VIAGVLAAVSGVLEQRFVRNAFFPALAFLAAGAIVGLAGRHRLAHALDGWQKAGGPTQAVVVVAGAAAAWFFAAIIDSQTRRITQLFEGYWSGPFARIAEQGKKRHQTILTGLLKAGKMSEVYQRYPLAVDDVMPTRLGNVLRASERYPFDRYGANAIIVWPRLYMVLPDSVIATSAQARASLEFQLVLAALGVLFSVLSGVYLVAITAAAWLFATAFWGGALVAVFAYQASLAAAAVYAESLRAAFDLYRLDALTHLQLPRPTNATDEHARWREFSRLVLRNDPLPQPYPQPPPENAIAP
jgi:hypothetical protein